MSCLEDGDRLMQCHGGLNYGESHEIKAYHNLIFAGDRAGDRARLPAAHAGADHQRNQAARRRDAAADRLQPVESHARRSAAWRSKLFIKNFEVYRGELGAEADETCPQES